MQSKQRRRLAPSLTAPTATAAPLQRALIQNLKLIEKRSNRQVQEMQRAAAGLQAARMTCAIACLLLLFGCNCLGCHGKILSAMGDDSG
jgi:hypothetical protein